MIGLVESPTDVEMNGGAFPSGRFELISENIYIYIYNQNSHTTID